MLAGEVAGLQGGEVGVGGLDGFGVGPGLPALFSRRGGVLDLLDVLKNADFLTGFTDGFASVAAYERIDRAFLQRWYPSLRVCPADDSGP
ncbi:hypothetical protein [Streptomyces incanus]|uniref:Uncharacterized protein n=1 Tax=Streptomyces incanus TaxID=887453 RepID=A0ABW0XJH9_9ACTN